MATVASNVEIIKYQKYTLKRIYRQVLINISAKDISAVMMGIIESRQRFARFREMAGTNNIPRGYRQHP